MEALKDHERWGQTQEEIIRENVETKREKALKVPFSQDIEETDTGIKPDDLAELHVLNRTMKEVSDFVTNHEYEIDSSLTKRDWLNAYHQTITEHRMNMDAVI